MFCFAIGILAGANVGLRVDTNPHDIGMAYLEGRRKNGDNLVNPLVFGCDYFLNYGNSRRYEALEEKFREQIDEEKKNGDVKEISLYFRDLNTECSFGVNENDIFFPASLMKVPLMMAYLKNAEKNPAILSKKFTYTADIETKNPFANAFPAKSTLEIGKAYTVDDMINKMIVNSDNRSYIMLLGLIDQDSFEDVLFSTGAHFAYQNGAYFVTTRSYSRLYRSLYDATFLNPEMSKRALSLLAISDFDMGIKSGTYSGTPVAHKFGINQTNGETQLHDCGIVYTGEDPYILCVMTQSKIEAGARKALSKISASVNKYFESPHPSPPEPLPPQ